MASTIHAVHDDDLEKFLASINSLEKFKTGHLKCCFCSDPITEINLYSIFPDSGDIKFSCNRPDCVIELKTRIEDSKYGSA